MTPFKASDSVGSVQPKSQAPNATAPHSISRSREELTAECTSGAQIFPKKDGLPALRRGMPGSGQQAPGTMVQGMVGDLAELQETAHRETGIANVPFLTMHALPRSHALCVKVTWETPESSVAVLWDS